ncbi:MAG: response regulator [Flavobacterium sp. BFFFF1]|uniref:response regulator n=1 Tax=unclassified Flavobacterium TaxID=196869 RepID=UPI000BD27F9D|nr:MULTISPECIES: response regulator [unclassified Flavobacterium]OYU79453.1 MAG: response regulator [Flavobacterium sp. BFFFF1]
MKEKPEYICKCMMIIDDNDIDRYIAKKVISHEQFCDNVLAYGNPVDALQYLRHHQDDMDALPMIILLDIYMPEMSGFEFMECYNQLSEALKKYCEVYIISSTIDPHDLTRAAIDKNVAALHVKPIDSAFLSSLRNK